MQERTKILDKAKELMMRFGVRSVSMDDIARELGISKKTLYQLVQSKEDIVSQIMKDHLEGEKCCIREFQDEARDAVEEMTLIAGFVIQKLRQISPSALYDLRKYYRQVWNEWERFHKKHIYDVIRRNLEKGMEEGLYREDMDSDIIVFPT